MRCHPQTKLLSCDAEKRICFYDEHLMYTHKKFKSFLTKAQVSIGNMNNQYTPNLIRKLVYWFLRRVGDGGGDGEWHL